LVLWARAAIGEPQRWAEDFSHPIETEFDQPARPFFKADSHAWSGLKDHGVIEV
jgi:hypothetical protein